MLRAGTLIAEKYRVDHLLGEGGMGSVYAVTNVVLGKPVALKVMGSGFAADAEATERFFREAMSASQVRHPAIVEIYDAGRTREGEPWMAMELLDGESLGERLHRMGTLPLSEVVPIFEPVLAALDAVHAQGIVHRDLKPDNIFLERLPNDTVQPKILDFGIAKRQDGLNKLTRTGAVMGTASYLAPEQARDSSTVDPRTDLYAIGVVLYEVLSGRMPHQAATLPELITKLVSEDPEPLLQYAPATPPALANVVHWCLARDTSARPQRAADLAHHLLSSLADIPAQISPPPIRTRGPVDPRAATGTADPAAPAAWAAAGLSPTRSGPPAGQAHPSAPGANAFGAGAGGGTQGWGPPPASAAPAWGPSPARPTARSGFPKGLVFGLVALSLGGGCLVFVLPLLLSLLGAATSIGLAGAGGSGFAPSYPRLYESFRAPLLQDVDGDGHEDVIAWGAQIVGSDTHELLCAYSGADGQEIWCADAGDEDDLSETETVLIGDRLIYFSAHGRATAYRLRDGESLGWNSSVRGQAEEICLRDAGHLMVRTPDRLWSEVSVATGTVTLVGEAGPATCAPARVMSPPRGLSLRVSSPTWTPVDRRARPRVDGLDTRAAWTDGSRVLSIGRARGQGRNPGLLTMLNPSLVWQEAVPNDPIRAQAQPPEVVAIVDDVIYAGYEMTARGDFPRRVAAFRASDGSRLWDVGLRAPGSRAWHMFAGDELLTLSASQMLFVLDRRTGAARFQLGQPPRR